VVVIVTDTQVLQTEKKKCNKGNNVGSGDTQLYGKGSTPTAVGWCCMELQGQVLTGCTVRQ